jgi:hypothetical protein
MPFVRTILTFCIVLFIAACATPDRGRCLASHQEDRPTAPIVMPSGLVVPSGTYKTVDVCDQWEYPNGKPTP